MKTIPADYLPPKFGPRERDAYQWLRDCGVVGFLVDLKTKKVHATKPKEKTWGSLPEYAFSLGWQGSHHSR